MSEVKQWNVMVPVVAIVSARTAEEAIMRMRRNLSNAGFDFYEGEPEANAFESEGLGDSGEQGGEDVIEHDTVREMTGEDA
jgi:hypothetical protein